MCFNALFPFVKIFTLDAESKVAACEECCKFIGPYPRRYQNVRIRLPCFPWRVWLQSLGFSLAFLTLYVGEFRLQVASTSSGQWERSDSTAVPREALACAL